MTNTPLLYTTASEVDGILQVYEGDFPADMLGSVYIVYQIGSVNSDGLPYPEFLPDGTPNPEYGSAIMSGDGMVMKIDLTDRPSIRTRIMKTPCYYADLNTRLGSEADHENYELLRFKNYGISRMSLMLGARNPLNTAVTPARFGSDTPVLVAAYDVGRPYLLDPVSLELITVLGTNQEWMTGVPAQIPWAFELIESTAHPCFDPHTQELFSVNYSQVENAVILADKTIYHLKHNRDLFWQKLREIMHQYEHNPTDPAARRRVETFFAHLDQELTPSKTTCKEFIFLAIQSFREKIRHFFKAWLYSDSVISEEGTSVTLMRFDGQGAWDKWILVDQFGKKLKIKNCMHQTNLTRDYIVLQDSSFKFSSELLISNPFPEDLELERFLRQVLSTTMLPYTDCYIVRRRDLVPGKTVAIAYQLDQPLPLETIHFSCNYENPDGQITLFGIHNAAMCVAEWVRPYDISALDGKSIDPEVLSLFSLGTMDISRLGKWNIDAENHRLLQEESTILAETGKMDTTPGPIGFNTWTIGLYTYRGIISAEEAPPTIDHLWFVTGGLDGRMLTRFIEHLYRDYPNRAIPYETVKALTRLGIPSGLNYLNTRTMQTNPKGNFQTRPDDYMRSVQFVPKKTPTPGVERGLDGYLLCSIQVAHVVDGSLKRRGEFWIFQADNIAQGPICKMFHPDVNFCFTLHSAWLAHPVSSRMAYRVDVREDYQPVIEELPDKEIIEPFFEKYVYPYF